MGCSYRRYYSVVRTIVTIYRFIGGNRISFFSAINLVETKKEKRENLLKKITRKKMMGIFLNVLFFQITGRTIRLFEIQPKFSFYKRWKHIFSWNMSYTLSILMCHTGQKSDQIRFAETRSRVSDFRLQWPNR